MTLLSIPVHDRTEAAIDAVVIGTVAPSTARAAAVETAHVEELAGALGTAVMSTADPFVSVVAEALAPAMRHVYALLWRVGLLEIVD
jgi:hypothetical protein